MAYYQQPPAAPGGDLNAKYAAANAELNQLYTLAASALPVNPDGVLQALVTCRTTIQALLSGGPPPAATPPPAAPAAPAPVPPADPAAPPPPPPGQQPVMAPPPPPGQTAMPAYAPPPGQAMPAYAPPPQTHMYAPPPPAMSGHAQGGAPPPPPAVLMPAGTYQQYHAPPPPPPEQANFDRSIYERHGWPARSYHKSLGEAIFQSQETPGNVRHEVVIEKRCIGRILGKGGRDLAAMKEASGAEVFIIDKEPPPGVDEDHRLVILVGTPDCVNACLVTVNKTLERARNELPPLPPPLSSGWRPVPSVGADLGWQHQQDNGRKRDRDDH